MFKIHQIRPRHRCLQTSYTTAHLSICHCKLLRPLGLFPYLVFVHYSKWRKALFIIIFPQDVILGAINCVWDATFLKWTWYHLQGQTFPWFIDPFAHVAEWSCLDIWPIPTCCWVKLPWHFHQQCILSVPRSSRLSTCHEVNPWRVCWGLHQGAAKRSSIHLVWLQCQCSFLWQLV